MTQSQECQIYVIPQNLGISNITCSVRAAFHLYALRSTKETFESYLFHFNGNYTVHSRIYYYSANLWAEREQRKTRLKINIKMLTSIKTLLLCKTAIDGTQSWCCRKDRGGKQWLALQTQVCGPCTRDQGRQ